MLPATLLKVRLADPLKAVDVGRVQDNIGRLLNEVAAVPILQGNAVVGVAFGSRLTLNVPHGLGRPWVGYTITDQDQPATIYRSSVANRDRFLTLTADATVTINLLVW